MTVPYDSTGEGRGLWGAAFWRGAAERALKTAAQTAVALLAADGASLLTVDWRAAGATVVGAAVLSVLTSIVSAPLGERGTPSLVDDTPGKHTLRSLF